MTDEPKINHKLPFFGIALYSEKWSTQIDTSTRMMTLYAKLLPGHTVHVEIGDGFRANRSSVPAPAGNAVLRLRLSAYRKIRPIQQQICAQAISSQYLVCLCRVFHPNYPKNPTLRKCFQWNKHVDVLEGYHWH